MNQFQPNNQVFQQLAQAEQIIQQLVKQTQQASMQYQQLLQQEQQNAVQLEQIAQRERQAAQVIQVALQGHQTAIQQMQQLTNICHQLANNSNNNHISNTYTNPINQNQPLGFYNN
jgi:regulator of replication initiation timing